MKYPRYTIYCSVLFAGMAQQFHPQKHYLCFCGIVSELNEIKDFFQSFTDFISTILSIIGIAGFQTLVLLFIVMVLSSGFAALGIPRGKVSFFISLTAADIFWIIWESSFKDLSLTFLLRFCRANIILLSPYIIISIIRWKFPAAGRRIRAFMRNVLSGGGKKNINAETARSIIEQSTGLQNSLINDILKERGTGEIKISDNTRKEYAALKKTLEVLEEKD